MRITAQAKQETRDRILATGERLFDRNGFATTTTRDLAKAAGVATGTLFNYFPSKEALAMTILARALGRGRGRYLARRRGEETLEEDLFAYVAAELRALRPYRSYVGPVLETAMSPFSRSQSSEEGEDARVRHLECATEIIVRHGRQRATTSVAMHLYWTLYLGVLAFWSTDESPNQEDTLVVLDQSMRLFAAALAPSAPGEDEPPSDDAKGVTP